jgi:hypothetical protein
MPMGYVPSFEPPVNWTWGFHWDEFLESFDVDMFPSISPVMMQAPVAPSWMPIIEGDEVIGTRKQDL